MSHQYRSFVGLMDDFFDLSPQFDDEAWIEIAERFVEQHGDGIRCDGTCKSDALLLTS